MGGSYYSSSIEDFLQEKAETILGHLMKNSEFSDTSQQKGAWEDTIRILKNQLDGLEEGHIMLEYTIPRMGKRVDAIVLLAGVVFVIEFKCNKDSYDFQDEDQVYGYAQDLKNFHKESENKLLIPILVPTEACA